jgi:serine/threonine protein phosphatase 1
MSVPSTTLRLIEEGTGRIFVIGDLHGCLHELNVILSYLENDLTLTPQDTVIFIGDYIDRGDDSRGVIERLIQLQRMHAKSYFLKGNHEEMLLSFLEGGHLSEVYLANGGNNTLESYGIDRGISKDQIQQQFPPDHLTFFHQLERCLISERFVFVHAGLDPLRPLKLQLDENLFWIRDEFINNIHYFGKVVVFGHTPYQDVLFHLPYKIGIDTGAVYSNKLSCIELREQVVYQVQRGATSVTFSKFPTPVTYSGL